MKKQIKKSKPEHKQKTKSQKALKILGISLGGVMIFGATFGLARLLFPKEVEKPTPEISAPEETSLVEVSFGDTTVKAETVNEALTTVYTGLQDGTYTSPIDSTITYHVYGHNETQGRSDEEIANKQYISFSMNGIFDKVNIIGQGEDAELELASDDSQAVTFQFTDDCGLRRYSLDGTDVYISNVSFLDNRPNASGWEHGYIEFSVGYSGSLVLDNCKFLGNGLSLWHGESITVTNCTFDTESGKYAIWIGANAFGSGYRDTLKNVTIDSCVFTGNRGIKILTDIHTTNEAGQVYERTSQAIKIQNCAFKDLIEKPGIVIDCSLDTSSIGNESKLTITNTTFEGCEKGDVEAEAGKGIQYTLNGNVVSVDSVE